MTTNELVNQLRYYRKCYYDGNPVVSDDIFDQMEKELEKIDPTNTYFNEIGYMDKTIDAVRKIRHVIPMKSMAKVKNPDDAVKWFHNTMSLVENPSNILYYEAKIDGNAGSLVYNENGNLKYVLSRGDGNEGLEIPQGFNFKNIPHKFIPNGEIRGEFYISKKDSDKVNGPLRNMCSGILKRKEETPEMDLIQFVMYDFYDHKKEVKFKNRKDKIDQLKTLLPKGSNVIDIMTGTNIHLMYNRYINELRDRWDYETDGIILTVEGDQSVYDTVNSGYNVENHNKYNLALKPPAKEATSKIVDIKLNLSKNGKIIPVAEIEPVAIGGVVISMVSLNNFASIKKNRIGIGTEVNVQRANDVIPYISEIVSNDNVKPFSIKRCPSCGGQIEMSGVDAYCTNHNKCKGTFVSRILNMLNVFGVKNVGEKYIQSIVNWLANNRDNLTLDVFVDFLLDKSGETNMVMEELFGSSVRKNNIVSSLMMLFDNVTEMNIIEAVSIPNIGRKTLEKMGIWDRDSLVLTVLKRQGCTNQSATDFTLIKWFQSDAYEEYDRFRGLLVPYIKDEKSENMEEKKLICLSGSFDKPKAEIAKDLESRGYKVVDNLTKDVDTLITNIGGTSKVAKALKWGIPIYTLDEFYKTSVK